MQGVSGNQAPTGGDKTNESVRARQERAVRRVLHALDIAQRIAAAVAAVCGVAMFAGSVWRGDNGIVTVMLAAIAAVLAWAAVRSWTETKGD